MGTFGCGGLVRSIELRLGTVHTKDTEEFEILRKMG
jgi:hypothetical protein